MSGESEVRNRLYREANEAFQAALDAAMDKPAPGTKAWNDWQRLVAQALIANQNYVSFLRGEWPDATDEDE